MRDDRIDVLVIDGDDRWIARAAEGVPVRRIVPRRWHVHVDAPMDPKPLDGDIVEYWPTGEWTRDGRPIYRRRAKLGSGRP